MAAMPSSGAGERVGRRARPWAAALVAVLVAGCSSSPAPSATRLALTDAVLAQLVAAGAASHGATAAEYHGVLPGSAYVAHDPATGFWAAAELNPVSYRAQVSNQDDGSYLLFHRTEAGAPWVVTNAGLAGMAGTSCPISVPAAVLAVWGWAPKTCWPPSRG